MTNKYLDEIDSLLNEDFLSIKEREISSFDKQANPYQDALVLFGAGILGRKTLVGLRKLGIEPLAFSDNNSELWGTTIDGLQVLKPVEAVQRFGEKAAFVLTIWSDTVGHPLTEVKKQLNSHSPVKIVSFAFLYWKYADIFLPYYGLDLPHKICNQTEDVRSASQLWADDSSKNEYLAQLRWRLFLDFEGLSHQVLNPQYFPTDLFCLGDDTVFVDCGAFDGDTIREFLRQQNSEFTSIIAFEPDNTNFQKLQNYIVSLPEFIRNKIVLSKLALSSYRGKVYFNEIGSIQSAVTEYGGREVECAPLDDILSKPFPTYIKMDIEGAEPDALLGMRKIIQEHLPILAISVYHRFDHLWKLPLLIRSFTDGYDFFLRPQAETVWELILYAIPRERLKKGKNE